MRRSPRRSPAPGRAGLRVRTDGRRRHRVPLRADVIDQDDEHGHDSTETHFLRGQRLGFDRRRSTSTPTATPKTSSPRSGAESRAIPLDWPPRISSPTSPQLAEASARGPEEPTSRPAFVTAHAARGSTPTSPVPTGHRRSIPALTLRRSMPTTASAAQGSGQSAHRKVRRRSNDAAGSLSRRAATTRRPSSRSSPARCARSRRRPSAASSARPTGSSSR